MFVLMLNAGALSCAQFHPWILLEAKDLYPSEQTLWEFVTNDYCQGINLSRHKGEKNSQVVCRECLGLRNMEPGCHPGIFPQNGVLSGVTCLQCSHRDTCLLSCRASAEFRNVTLINSLVLVRRKLTWISSPKVKMGQSSSSSRLQQEKLKIFQNFSLQLLEMLCER